MVALHGTTQLGIKPSIRGNEAAFKKISQVMEEVVTSPEFQAEAQKLKTGAYWMPSAEFEKLYEKEYDEYGKIISDVLAK